MDAAVIGAGLAGLAAAVALVQSGARVTVYEAGVAVGGRMRSDTLDGATVDPAVQLVSSTYSAFFALARTCDADDLIVRAPGRDALWRGGSLHEITYGSVGSMVTSNALPTMLKLKLGTRYLAYLASAARTLDVNDLVGTVSDPALDEESVAAWGEREMGSDFVELLAYPLLGAYYGSAPEDAMAALYHALARVGMDVRVHAMRGGMGALPADITRWLVAHGATVHTEVPVRRIQELPPGAGTTGFTLELESGEARHDAVVVATPAPVARALLAERSALADWLAGVRTAPTITVAFLLERPFSRAWFGLSFPRTHPPGDRLVALTAQSHKLPSLVPDGREVVVAFPAPAITQSLVDAEPGAVVDELLPAAEQALPGFGARVLRARTYAFPEGYTLFPPGHLGRLRAFQDEWLPPGAALAGDYLVAPTVEGAVRSGLAAARRVLGAGEKGAAGPAGP